MADTDTESAPVADSWESYWRTAASQAALTSGDSGHPVVIEFWHAVFSDVHDAGEPVRVIDVASGNGAVVECASAIFADDLPEFVCVDYSPSAVGAIERRFPGASGVVADIAAIPLPPGSFDIATSQFGLEYAGLGCLDEITRILAPGGQLVALLHHRGGSIYRQCARNLDASRALQDSSFMPLARRLVNAGVDAMKSGDRSEYQSAGRQLAPAIRSVEAIIAQHGNDAAEGMIVRLYRDVRQMTTRMSHYERSDVLDWFDKMQAEIDAYAGRMAAMTDVAIDENSFESIRNRLVAAGFDIRRAEPLKGRADELPVAWALIASRR